MPSATPGRRPYSSCNPSPHCTGLAMSLPFLPFRASAPIERPISLSRITAVSLLPASIGKESAFPNDHFGADYRIQLLSLHLANLSSPRSSRCRAPIRAVDWTLPEGIRTLSTREPFPGSRLAPVAPAALAPCLIPNRAPRKGPKGRPSEADQRLIFWRKMRVYVLCFQYTNLHKVSDLRQSRRLDSCAAPSALFLSDSSIPA
jgi:hypothetical protein